MAQKVPLAACLESARAATIACHSAAGLLTTAGHREAARLLRSAEACSRAAAALLQAAKVTHFNSPSTRGPAVVVAAPVGAGTIAAHRKRRRQRKRSGIAGVIAADVDLDDSRHRGRPAGSGAVTDPILEASAAALSTAKTASLAATPTSLGGDAAQVTLVPLPDPGAAAPTVLPPEPSCTAAAADFRKGDVVLLRGPLARVDLVGALGTIESDASAGADARWAVRLRSDEKVLMKATKLCLFVP